ncbi:Hypothetical protein DENG_00500 [Enterococcus faecalis DENG1]|nr:Hypothetical protein DENG_00500 [Enterococcus faecalis DENG1]OSH06254.1 hypothetical protein ELS84_2983 [Enterococcus faecalis]
MNLFKVIDNGLTVFNPNLVYQITPSMNQAPLPFSLGEMPT